MKLLSYNRLRAVTIIHSLFLSLFAALLVIGSPSEAFAKKDRKPSESAPDSNLLYMKGRQMYLDGDFEKAAPLLEQALKADPENPFVSHQLAEVYLRLNEIDKATTLAEKAVSQDPTNVEYLATLGGVYATAKRFDESKTQYKKILEVEPTNRKAPLLIGILEAESGELADGAKTLSGAIEKNSDDVMAFFYRAKIYLEMEQIDKAKKDLAKCLELRPSFVEAGTALGLLQERLGEKDAAIETYSSIRGNGKFKKYLAQLYLQKNQFEKALIELLDYERSEPDDYTARVKIALIFFELKRYDQALTRFTGILKEQPEADNVRFYLGAVYEETREYDKALATFQKVSTDSSFYKEAVLHSGFIYRKRGKTDEGLKFSTQILKKSPDVVEYYDMQASFLEAKNKFSDALKVLEAGLKKFPEDEKLLYFQGALYDKLGERDHALANMENILKANPSNAHALNFVGYTYGEMGKELEKAEAYVRKALELRPNDGFIEDSLGWILFKKGKIAESIEHLLKAAQMQPDEAIIYEHLGDVYSLQKKYADALKQYEKAYQLTAKRDSQTAKKISEKLAKAKEDTRIPSAQ